MTDKEGADVVVKAFVEEVRLKALFLHILFLTNNDSIPAMGLHLTKITRKFCEMSRSQGLFLNNHNVNIQIELISGEYIPSI